MNEVDICIVGGAGHVGLPLALAFTKAGLHVCIQDLNTAALAQIESGSLPFSEENAEPLLDEALKNGLLTTSADPQVIQNAKIIVVTIGTPVDEFLNPEIHAVRNWADSVLSVLRDDQLIVLRSTLYPGTTQWLEKYFHRSNKFPQLAFCPERIAQGKAIVELQTLPQLVSGTTSEAEDAAAELFLKLAPEVIRLSPIEAEFAKLMTNAYRYISFAIANQFYMLADQAELDFERILHGCRHDYPRMVGFPGPGFTAGPCLFKDTMQLAAFSNNEFGLGHSAMLVNEGMPRFLVDRLKSRIDISTYTVGILGMSFKADIDDRRASLSYKLKKILELECQNVLCSDPYVSDDSLVSIDQVLAEADVVFIGTPHTIYRELNVPDSIHVVDIWNCLNSVSTKKPKSVEIV